jgi:hypothetical protein
MRALYEEFALFGSHWVKGGSAASPCAAVVATSCSSAEATSSALELSRDGLPPCTAPVSRADQSTQSLHHYKFSMINNENYYI